MTIDRYVDERMRLRGCWKTCFLVALHLVAASAQGEVFEEDLTLRPLRDGKLEARFSFTTLLKGATPRDPQSLEHDDDGMCSQLSVRSRVP